MGQFIFAYMCKHLCTYTHTNHNSVRVSFFLNKTLKILSSSSLKNSRESVNSCVDSLCKSSFGALGVREDPYSI